MSDIKVGIIGAMDSEVSDLKAQLIDAETKVVAGNEYVSGRLNGVDAVVVKCGIGKVNAAVCAQALCDLFGVTHVINTGVAGSLDAKIDICDIVVATDAVEHDLDVTPLGYRPGEHPDFKLVAFEADTHLREVILEAAATAAPDIHAYAGRICSGDQFIGSGAAKERITSTFEGSCCEMEGASIAHVCWLNKVPFAEVRAISDKADDSGSMNYQEFEIKAAANSTKIVLAAIANI